MVGEPTLDVHTLCLKTRCRQLAHQRLVLHFDFSFSDPMHASVNICLTEANTGERKARLAADITKTLVLHPRQGVGHHRRHDQEVRPSTTAASPYRPPECRSSKMDDRPPGRQAGSANVTSPFLSALRDAEVKASKPTIHRVPSLCGHALTSNGQSR